MPGLVLGATSAAKAVDFKMTGLWQNRVSFADRNFEKHNGDDKMRAATRLRTQIDVIASESLKGVMFFEIGHQNWGKAAEGAALGTDGKEIKVRYSYVDWIIPQTDVKVRMGLQPYVQPTFTGIGSPILDADGAGITISNQFTENVSASLFWLRAENDNDPEMTKHDAHDAMDFIGVTVPMTFDGVKVTPWAMVGMIGRDSLDTDKDAISQKGGLIPIQADISPDALKDRHNTAWWVGVASELTYFDPFRIAVDAAYGSVDMGSYKTLDGRTIRDFDVKRAGWFASILGEYKMDYFTPGILFWYASGDDSNAYNGSERMPAISPCGNFTSFVGDDPTGFGMLVSGLNATYDLQLNYAGTWGLGIQIKDVSFIEDLTHTLRIARWAGTNSPAMIKYLATA